MVRINLMTLPLHNALRVRRWRERNPDKVRTIRRTHYVANREKELQRTHNWVKNNREKARAIKRICDRKRRVNNPDKRNAWKLSNPEKMNEYKRAWANRNQEKVHEIRRCSESMRRARRKGTYNSWTIGEWQTLKCQYHHRCVGCWKSESDLTALGLKLVPDHIVPLSKSGLNHITNLQPLCHGTGGCNNKKGARFHDFVIS